MEEKNTFLMLIAKKDVKKRKYHLNIFTITVMQSKFLEIEQIKLLGVI